MVEFPDYQIPVTQLVEVRRKNAVISILIAEKLIIMQIKKKNCKNFRKDVAVLGGLWAWEKCF